MLNFYLIKENLKSGQTRYRTILTKSGKGMKSKTFHRKQNARVWGSRFVLENQEYEAGGIPSYTVTFDGLANE